MNIKSKVGTIFVTMMLLIALTIPASACVPKSMSELEAGIAENFTIETEGSLGELSALLDMTLDEDARTVIKDIQDKGFEVQYSDMVVQTIEPKTIDAPKTTIVTIPAISDDTKNTAKVLFISNTETTMVGNMVIEIKDGYGKADIFEFINGVEKKTIVENKNGNLYLNGELAVSKNLNATMESTSMDCDICKSMYDYIYGIGCGLTGIATCALGCAAFTGPAFPACGPICGAVFIVLCIYGTHNTVDIACSQYC
ncbi:hypothetical protein [Methanolobus psychrotolerans]|uniref:hypothetical protein n=1 Tax=Methanolobus psychrotolerans TaxID=1874706 RepID=UPI000B91924C|nr:hypothetical protein [Methanolobus psychrotolerans]